MQCTYNIKLKPGSKPFALFKPRRIAIPLRPRVKEELQRMERLGVIEKVDKPTEWCAGIVLGTSDTTVSLNAIGSVLIYYAV